MRVRSKDRLSEVVKLLVDGGYTGENFARGVAVSVAATVEVVKPPELHKFAVMPKRWIMERSFAWLEKCRRLWENCERSSPPASNLSYSPS
jgi:transposase